MKTTNLIVFGRGLGINGERLIRSWALHVDKAKHVSHKQNGEPLFELSRDARGIQCRAPGCPWRANVKKKGGK